MKMECKRPQRRALRRHGGGVRESMEKDIGKT